MEREWKFAAAAGLAGVAAFAWRSWARDKPSPMERDRIGYPPLDRLKQVSDEIWIVDSGPMKAGGLSIPIRLTVIRLITGELLLHSPTKMTDALVAELQQLGPVRHLLAPSIAHWTFLPDWQKAFGDAEVWAVPGLRDRPQVRSSGLRIDHDLSNNTPEGWAGDLEQGLVHGGTGFTEAYLFHRASRTLVLVDLIQNLEPSRLPPVTAAVAELSRATVGRTAAHVRVATAVGGTDAKEQIRHLLSLEPERVIFAHGRWFDSGAAERLRQAFGWLL